LVQFLLIENSRGSDNIILDNYVFEIKRRNNDTIIWRCKSRTICNAIVVTFAIYRESWEIKEIRCAHQNYEPENDEIQRGSLIDLIKIKILERNSTPKSALNEVMKGAEQHKILLLKISSFSIGYYDHAESSLQTNASNISDFKSWSKINKYTFK
jgi:hypothetical protein